MRLQLLMIAVMILGSTTSSAFSSRAVAPASAVDSVWVKRPDGAVGCAPEKAQDLDAGTAELRKAAIQVLDSRKSRDGKLHIQVCGAPTGSENAYLIPRADLPKALALGFQESRK